jgi:hypothetical protein
MNTAPVTGELIMALLVALTVTLICWVWPWYMNEYDRIKSKGYVECSRSYYKVMQILLGLWLCVFVITLFTNPYGSANPFKTGIYHVTDRTNGGETSTLGICPENYHAEVVSIFEKIPSLTASDRSCKFIVNKPALLTADEVPHSLCSKASIAPYPGHSEVVLVNKTATSFTINVKTDEALRWSLKITTDASLNGVALDSKYRGVYDKPGDVAKV